MTEYVVDALTADLAVTFGVIEADFSIFRRCIGAPAACAYCWLTRRIP